MRRWSVFLLAGLLLAGVALAQDRGQGGQAEAQRAEFLRKYVRQLTAQEARKWVASQGTHFLYVGKDEMFPGLGEALRGKEVKVYGEETTATVPWLDRSGVRYTLYRMPGRLTVQGSVLVALESYVLGPERDAKGRPTGKFTLITYKEVANVLYRVFSAYEAFAKEVSKR